MEFIISKTSVWGDDKPLRAAYLKSVTPRDFRTARTLASGEKQHWYKDWHTRGINHREERGYIVCDHPMKEAWVIDIENLDELLELMEAEGEIIVKPSESGPLCPKEIPYELEIYDGYRE